jgi:ATPase family AAA domain-containing protein 3A/B
MAKMQEKTTQMKHQQKLKETEATIANLQLQHIQTQEDEKRKTLSSETYEHQKRAQYQDQLARRRYDDQLLQQRQVNEANLRRQEESVEKQESMRRSTIEYEAQLRHENEMKRLQAELMGKAKIDRENQDLTLERIKVKAAEHRETILQSIKYVGIAICTVCIFMSLLCPHLVDACSHGVSLPFGNIYDMALKPIIIDYSILRMHIVFDKQASGSRQPNSSI